MQNRQLSASERADWLRLARTERIGPMTFRQLVRRFGTAREALDALPEVMRRGGKRVCPPSPAQIDGEIERLEKSKGRFIALCEPDYPQALASIEDAPPVIAVRGDPSRLQARSIGIVGARNASLNGRKMAGRLAQDLGQENFVVVSGLARGIDTAAHHASLATGTVAVIAGGVDIVYPEENRGLYEKIAEQGAVVSDQPMGCEPKAQLFPKRNRIIAGLSLGVVVVEAARQSGSLITARMALEQGREVFAVPGSPLDPRAQGTNDLLRQGAVLTESAQDVTNHIFRLPLAQLDLPNVFAEPEPELPPDELDVARAAILNSLSPSPTAIDDLIRQSCLPMNAVMTILLDLELSGEIERQPGHKIALIAKG